MLALTLRFPLGVYYALGPGTDGDDSHRTAEWPPSPVRIVGALLDAAHTKDGGATNAALTLIDRIAAAPAPWIEAPAAQRPDEADPDKVAVLRGPSRWAPRNPAKSELKGLSLRDIAGPRAAVDKGGVAVGDHPVRIGWPTLELSDEELGHLRALLAEVAWLGTSRSPVLIEASTEPGEAVAPRWEPLPHSSAETPAVKVRVPNAATIGAFDAEYARRFSTKDKVEASGLQKPASAGTLRGYAAPQTETGVPVDPMHWGEAYVLEVAAESVTLPKAPAAYEVARAIRAALLAQFDGDDAPELLRGRGATPHVAVVPLPFIGAKHADGRILGVAVWLPHPARLEGDLSEIDLVEGAIDALLQSGGIVGLGGNASVQLRAVIPMGVPLRTLDLARYRQASRHWVTATPVVYSQWRASKSEQGLVDQVVADCAHVGLPAPAEIKVLRQSPLHAAAPGSVDRRRLRPEWRGPIDGPTGHLQLIFREPIRGPILLGRARHFGLGLMLPASEDAA